MEAGDIVHCPACGGVCIVEITAAAPSGSHKGIAYRPVGDSALQSENERLRAEKKALASDNQAILAALHSACLESANLRAAMFGLLPRVKN
jgi:hypothetical protein